jgi:hypothetical protein
MLDMTETQNQMMIQESIEVPDPAQPEAMMSLSIESRAARIQEVTEKLDEVDINSKESLDIGLMETLDHTIQEEIPDEEIEDMMYEEDRYWNMEELTEWNDEYVIGLGDENQEQQECAEEKEEAMMLTNLECENLIRFLIQEAAEKPKVFCKDCSKRQCVSCDNLRSKYSEEDQETYKKVWDNVNLVQDKGKTRVKATTCTETHQRRVSHQRIQT